MTPQTLTLRATALAATLLTAGLAHAQFSTDGYLRAGTGAGTKDDSTACFKLGGDGLNYRLGNECDTFVEINLKNTVKVGGMQFSGNIMPTYYGSGNDSPSTGLGQAFIEANGLDFAPGINFWVGKRYYGRSDVHITDTKYTQLDGTGGGADNIDLGVGKLGVSYFRRDTATFPGWGTASRFNIEFSTSQVNEGGWLRVLLGIVNSEEMADKDGNAVNGRGGQSLTLQHYQHNLFGLGGGNTLWLQSANGSAGLNGGFVNAYNGNGNDWITTDASNTTWVEDHGKSKRTRIADSFSWQQGNFGGAVVAHLQKDNNTQYTTTSTSLGGRLSYAFTNNFKLVGEAGQSSIKAPGTDTQKLSKFTIAPTLTTGKGLNDRPELRLFYTKASWNDAAAAANSSLPAGSTSGKRFGVQAEIWW